MLGRVAVVGLAALLGMVALLAIAACGQTDEESPPAGQLAAAVTTSAAQSACDKVALASNTGPTGPYASPAYVISLAYASTAGAASTWEETPPDPADPNGPHATVSRFRSYSPDAPVFVCILSGQFGGPPFPPDGSASTWISGMYIVTPTGVEAMIFSPRPMTADDGPPASSTANASPVS